MSNPFFEALEKFARHDAEYSPETRELEPRETYEPAPEMHDQLIEDAIQEAEIMAQTTPEAEAAIDDVMDAIPPQSHGYKYMFEQQAHEEWSMEEKIAHYLPYYGSIAKLVDWAQGIECSEEMQKHACELLDAIGADATAFDVLVEKVASELFATPENEQQLYSVEGMEYVVDKLALLHEQAFEKVANTAGQQPSHMERLKNSIGMFAQATKNLMSDIKNAGVLKAEHEHARDELQRRNDMLPHLFSDPSITPEQLDAELLANRGYRDRYDDLSNRIRNANVAKGVGAGLLAGGTLYATKKIYDMVNQDGTEKQAFESNNVLISKVANGKLNSETRSGGNHMSKQIVREFLKLAGAAALIELANNEGLDMSIRKEASDRFDAIASCGRTQMEAELIKTAQALYPEQQLHEIVAGHHTQEIFDKLAFFFEVNEMSADELNKVANAGGVAAKGVAGALTDAAKQVVDNISQSKAKAEGAGREYVGELGATGKAGGGLVGENLDGYNVIKNPSEYAVEHTAAMLEEAVLAKQAAIETYRQADSFIKKYAR